MALSLVKEKFGRDVLDIHAGAVDLIFPHHEDEIAQSCAHTGEADFARVWMHGEFLTMAGTKMSKRFGNILTARDLRIDGVDAGALRLLFATTHYRQKLDFTDDALDAAREGSRRLSEFDSRLRQRPAADLGSFDRIAVVLDDEFTAAMDDDLNTPRALAALFEAVRAGNRALDGDEDVTRAFIDVWSKMTAVLQVVGSSPAALSGVVQDGSGAGSAVAQGDTPPDDARSQQHWAEYWAGQRVQAKGAADYPEADRIRALLAEHGWEVRDARDGTATVRRRS
jgi:cysteinyl-tRNA synthetase